MSQQTAAASIANPVNQTAEIVREYGPFEGVERIHGVSHDGQRIWAATGADLIAIDPISGETVRRLHRPCDAGTAFDGTHLYQSAEARIHKIDPATGQIVASIPAPGQGGDSGMAWAEGSLWVGQYRNRQIHQIDPATGQILRTIASNRFVTGVTWVDGELWHGTWEEDDSDIRRIDPQNGQVLTRLEMPRGTGVSGLESDGAGLLYAGGGGSGKIRAVRRPGTVLQRVVTRDQWIAQRKVLLAREKELTRLCDQVAAERRALPWVRLDKDYIFDTPQGPRRLADLFQGRRQLLVQHFMFGPGWEDGCPSCSFMADHLDGMSVHLAQRDLSLLVVSRAPLPEIARFKQRMGWQFNWVSSNGNDFNSDFNVSFTPEAQSRGEVYYNYEMTAFPAQEAPGISVFYKGDDGEVYHTYSTYGRGVEVMMGTYSLLDLAPKGRDEQDLPHAMGWVRHHDRYETPQPADKPACCSRKA